MTLTPDPVPPEYRIADTDRQRTVELLRQHCTEGRITLDEFSERVGVAFEAKTVADLQNALRELPVPFGPPVTPPITTSEVTGRRTSRWTLGIMSGGSQKGRWRVRGETNALAIMGGVELDLRGAEVEGNEVVINAYAFMGGIEIVVPEGILVELSGFAFMGGKDARIRPDVPIIPGAPVVHVRAFAIMGGVSVKSKPPLRPGPRRRVRHRDQRLIEAEARPMPRWQNLLEEVTDNPSKTVEALESANLPDGTVTIMFSDIEGFTAMTERLGDRRAQEVLREHNELIRSQVASCGGQEVKAQGDGFMIAFAGAGRALRCAIGVQRALEDYNDKHLDNPVRVHIGLHTGEVIKDAGDFLGGAVILAARMAQEARGGEVLVSSVTKDLTDLTGEFTFGEGRDVMLKGLSQPRRVYPVVWSDAADTH
jgi:class 3 adenylate cyclase